MKRWQLVVLIFELALFAAILVLPQVALPAFTFHGGTAPVVAHARVCHSARSTLIATILPQTLVPGQTGQFLSAIAGSFSPPALPHLSRLCVLIC
jgi:hypothetical protein